MVLSYTREVNQSFKERMAWWYFKLKNIKQKIWEDPWIDFMLCWMIFDAYLTEISQCDRDCDKLNYFYKNNCDFKNLILKKWSTLSGHVIELKKLSPIQDMRPRSNEMVYLNNENDLEQIFKFIYQIRCNLFHGSKDIKNLNDNKLVRYAANFLRGSIDNWMNGEQNSKILIHTCCAVCGAYLTEVLKADYEPVIFFYNPNIHPREEYEKRKESAVKLAEIYKAEFVEGDYDDKNWTDKIKGLEGEKEGGKRCTVCFEMRLQKTAEEAKRRGIKYFATTLAVSPYKNEKLINEIGQRIAKENGLEFITINSADKKDIWDKSRKLAKDFNFYHQNYCGCTYSIWKK
ncbi:MAG: epoxyqueuosine reductase QueH [Candidatus Pacebacteria bacterium]|nr:epoxyqueuosine reductase QueH [Candidatus Paceibacterota bacterium]